MAVAQAGANTQELVAEPQKYNYDIVRKFTVMCLIWGALGMFAGVYIASEMAYPFLNFDIPYITFGRYALCTLAW